MYSTLKLMLAVVATVSAKTITINVGQSGLSFSPDSSTADVGDTLEFHFFGSIHTAVQSDFSSPCHMSSGGFDSGPIQNGGDGSGSVFQVTVKDTNPLWFFCGTPGHCQSGMAGVINPPSSGDSLATYKANASGTSSQSGGTVEGGVVVPVPSAGGSSSTTSSSSSSVPPSSSKSTTATESTTTSASESTSTSSTSKSGSESESSSASKSVSSSGSKTAAATTSTSASKSSGSSGSASSSAASSPTSVTVSGGAITVGRVEIYTLMGAAVAALGFWRVAI